MLQSESIRVLFVDHTAQLGGGEIALRNLLDHLDRDRVSIEVLLCAEGPLAEQLRKRYHVHILPLSAQIADARKDSIQGKGFLRLHFLSIPLYAARIARRIRSLKIDVVHTNSLKSHVIGGLAARMAGRPVIWHLRDRIAPDYLPRAAVKFIRILSRVLPTRIIANSRATLNTITTTGRHCIIKSLEQQSRVVHDGCTIPDTIVPANWSGPLTIGLIGRLSPWKGQHVFIKAAALIAAEFPKAHFQIIGSPLFAEGDYERELKALAAEVGVEDRVEFTGFVADVQGAIAKLNIVVHASTIGEPFGQVIIEGMAAGRVVIATNGGGVPEIVQDKVTGLLVPVNDAESLAEAMRTLLRDPARAEDMGRKGRERAREFFNLQRTARGVEQVYKEIISSGDLQRRRFNAISARTIDP